MTGPLAHLLPPRRPPLPVRCGYALLDDLEDAERAEALAGLERFQLAFLAHTRSVWDGGLPVPADTLAHWSRQWEAPYAWTALAGSPGRLLDAGSGFTFLPFAFAAAGHEVVCCDSDDEELGYAGAFAAASRSASIGVRFQRRRIEELPADTFDGAACISVLEHIEPARRPTAIDALARTIRPGGRLVCTVDVALHGGGEVGPASLGELIEQFERRFEPLSPVDLRRPPSLLTSECFRERAQWRLPAAWRSLDGPSPEPFRSVAVIGLAGVRRHRRRQDCHSHAGGPKEASHDESAGRAPAPSRRHPAGPAVAASGTIVVESEPTPCRARTSSTSTRRSCPGSRSTGRAGRRARA